MALTKSAPALRVQQCGARRQCPDTGAVRDAKQAISHCPAEPWPTGGRRPWGAPVAAGVLALLDQLLAARVLRGRRGCPRRGRVLLLGRPGAAGGYPPCRPQHAGQAHRVPGHPAAPACQAARRASRAGALPTGAVPRLWLHDTYRSPCAAAGRAKSLNPTAGRQCGPAGLAGSAERARRCGGSQPPRCVCGALALAQALAPAAGCLRAAGLRLLAERLPAVLAADAAGFAALPAAALEAVLQRQALVRSSCYRCIINPNWLAPVQHEVKWCLRGWPWCALIGLATATRTWPSSM